MQDVALPQFTLEVSKAPRKTGDHCSHTVADDLIQSGQQLHLLTIKTAFRDDVASIGCTETPKDRIDRIWVLLIRFNASKAFGIENVGSMMSKLVDEFAAFLGVGETEKSALAARTLDKGLDECLFVQVHTQFEISS